MDHKNRQENPDQEYLDEEHPSLAWQVNLINPRLPWNKQPLRPAEIGDLLCSVMLRRENLLEDARYNKIVANCFIVELGKENYQRSYQPIRDSLMEQWQEKVLESLMTANSRMGRKEFRFAGPVKIQLRPSAELAESQARILTAILPADKKEASHSDEQPEDGKKALAYLELYADERRWSLFPGDNTIGRSESCDIYLDIPLIQEKRLVSGKHAHISGNEEACRLLDGSLSGKPSANGTYVNFKRIPEEGIILRDGDTIILASVNPHDPQVDTPGVAVFRFLNL
jgi:hypothetical protein